MDYQNITRQAITEHRALTIDMDDLTPIFSKSLQAVQHEFVIKKNRENYTLNELVTLPVGSNASCSLYKLRTRVLLDRKLTKGLFKSACSRTTIRALGCERS